MYLAATLRSCIPARSGVFLEFLSSITKTKVGCRIPKKNQDAKGLIKKTTRGNVVLVIVIGSRC
jgi:hypothetical protein